ncbi:hypothetical protein K0B03_00700 [Patescibacteria group bacterium]|nr:hypothetical protein [Patescibacteria group bacterium]
MKNLQQKVKSSKNFAPLSIISEQFSLVLFNAFIDAFITAIGQEEKDLHFVHQLE